MLRSGGGGGGERKRERETKTDRKSVMSKQLGTKVSQEPKMFGECSFDSLVHGLHRKEKGLRCQT